MSYPGGYPGQQPQFGQQFQPQFNQMNQPQFQPQFNQMNQLPPQINPSVPLGYRNVQGYNLAPDEVCMPFPDVRIPNCPPGLEYLTQIDQILVKQKKEIFEAITGWETLNKYSVKNSLGQKIYFAQESTGCCNRICCGPLRPFEMNLVDNFGRKVLLLDRPLRCDSCFGFCCLQEMTVYDSTNNILGHIEQQCSLLRPNFKIKNSNRETIFRIQGPICTSSCLGNDVKFKVLSRDSSVQVGTIAKQWSGVLTELLTDADHFYISFPMDLDVRMKAVLLGAVFLIDFMYYEKSGNNN